MQGFEFIDVRNHMIDPAHAALLQPLNIHDTYQSEEVTNGQTQRTNDVAKQFESIFMAMVLKEMRKTTGEEGLFQGDSSDIYGGMFDLFMAQHIADGARLGLAEMMESTLQGRVSK